MLFSVPGDPKHLPFAAKAELQYIKISIFLLDGISIHSERREEGGRKGGQEDAFLFLKPNGQHPQRLS